MGGGIEVKLAGLLIILILAGLLMAVSVSLFAVFIVMVVAMKLWSGRGGGAPRV